MITTFLGAPGTGKGTVAGVMKQTHNFKHISTGDIFRKIIKSESELGLEVKAIIAEGKLIDDQLTNKVLVEGLKEFDVQNDNIILDGYPRTIDQANFLESYSKENNIKFDTAILFNLDNETIVKRLSGRRVCPTCGKTYHVDSLKPMVEGICDVEGDTLVQREDDQPDKIVERLKVYDLQTKPLVNFYKDLNKLVEFDANETPATTAEKVFNTLNK
ncbi:MAG: adenylate kinase [Tenericutes bacterium]|nr:MAG: adenylate kinase [Mycoplasmatota bacterium]